MEPKSSTFESKRLSCATSANCFCSSSPCKSRKKAPAKPLMDDLLQTNAAVCTTSPEIVEKARGPKCASVISDLDANSFSRSISNVDRNIQLCIVTIATNPSDLQR